MIKSRDIPEDLILPEHQNYQSPFLVRIIGLMLRVGLAFLSAFSLIFMCAQSLHIDISLTLLFLTAFSAFIVGAAMSVSVKFFAAGLGAFAAVSMGFFVFVKGFANILENSFYAVENLWRGRLDECGYTFKNQIHDLTEFTAESGISEEFLLTAFFSVAFFIFGTVLALCILKKVRILPCVIIMGAPTLIFFFFGMCESNLATALAISSFGGIASLSLYDNLYVSKTNIKSAITTAKKGIPSKKELLYTQRGNSFLGGYCGAAVTLFIFLLMLPIIGINKAMADIPEISRPAMKFDAVISSAVNGKGGGITGLFFLGSIPEEAHGTKAENIHYKGAPVLEVYSDVKVPVYLRQWVGIDYYDDGWHTASPDRISAYRDTFGSGFTSEFLTSELLRMIDPDLVELPDDKKFSEHESLGYITAPVYINKLSSTSALVLAPSFADQRIGFIKYGSREKAAYGYNNYYDGMFSSTAYMFMDKYGMISQIPYQKDAEFAKNLGILARYYAEQSEFILKVRQMYAQGYTQKELEDLYSAQKFASFSSFNDGYALPSGENSLAYRYVFEMSDEERRQADAVIDNLVLYRNYVYENYLSPCESSSKLETLMVTIMENAKISRRSINYGDGTLSYSESYKNRHGAVMALTDYLFENMTYTLNPKEPSENREYINGAETFLFDTKEGYCVQYATAAAMLLRSVGIPARYAQGFAANDYIASHGDAPSNYKSVVKDNNGHAWIEVYYDFYGWVQYEVTFSQPEDSLSDIGSTDTPPLQDTEMDPDTTDGMVEETTDGTSSKDESADTDSEREADPEEHREGFNITAVVVVFAVVILISAGVVLVCRWISYVNKKYDKIRDISDKKPQDLKDCGRKIGDMIMALLKFSGITIEPGERWENFASRCEKMMGGISKVLTIVRKCEFAEAISAREYETLVGGFDKIIDTTMEKKGALRGFIIKYFLLLY